MSTDTCAKADHVGRVALVSGATSGIGLETASRLANSGCHVIGFGLGTAQASSSSELLSLVQADVSVYSDVSKLVGSALDCFGRVDYLVNNAAIHPYGTIEDTSFADWHEVMAVNLTGLFNCTRAVIPHMRERRRGSIVNVASRASWGQPNLFAYSASKGGVLAASFALAYDYLQYNVRVNVVVPTAVRSGMTIGLADFDRLAAQSVAGRVTEPRDVAAAISFLLSDDAETVSGAVLNVNSFAGQGGM